jgi:hypothetical protein
VLYFDRFVTELFETKTKQEAFDMIDKARPFLKSMQGARANGWVAENMFSELIEVEEVTKSNEIDLENPEDPALRKLEESLNV